MFKQKKIISILALFALTTAVFAQELPYRTFPVSDAYWGESSGGYQCYYCCSDYNNIIYGDTLVNGINYHKIRRKGILYWQDSNGNCTSNPQSVFDYYVGAFREDSLLRKIYFLPEGSLTDTLLYDFNIQTGDTLPESYINNNYFEPKIVSTVDSVAVGKVFHRRFGISNSYSQEFVYLIEGIGSTFGLLGFIEPPFEFGTTLICFSKNGFTVYPDTINNCELITGLDPLNTEGQSVIISPNPFRSSFIVTAQNAKILQLELYSGIGRLIYKTDVNGLSQFEVDLSKPIESGFYILKILTDKGLITKNIVKS